MKKSIVSKLSGRFATVSIKNNKRNQEICGQVLSETPNYLLVRDINAKVDQRIKKTSIAKIKSGKTLVKV
ncbi:MAG: hypothetical protein ISP71_08320 [Flavobacteriales bacterium]|nr:hypothetical protein [Flavobacteriales bacterium]